MRTIIWALLITVSPCDGIYRRHIFRFYYNLEACTGALYLVHKFGKSKL